MYRQGTVTGYEIGKNRNGEHDVLLLQVQFANPSDVQTVELIKAPGDDSNPALGSKIWVTSLGDAYKVALAADDGIAPEKTSGEKKSYSTFDGAIKTFTEWLITGISNWWAETKITITAPLIELTGDTYWTGLGSGMIYGSMYAFNSAVPVPIGSIGVHVPIPSGLLGGMENLCTFQNGKEILVLYDGIYKIDFSIGAYTAIPSQTIEAAATINGIYQPNITGQDYCVTPAFPVNISGSGILSLTKNQTVGLSLANYTAAQPIIVEHVSMSMVMIGS